MHIAVLGNRGSWYCGDLKRAARERGHRYARIDFTRLTGHVGLTRQALTQQALTGDGVDLTALDALIVRTMPPGSLEQVVYRMDALARLESAGVVVVNPPKTIECAVDKYLTISKLAAAGLTVPETIVCENFEAAMDAFFRLGGDVVVKPLFGAEGRGIVRVSDPDLAFRTFRTLERIQAVLYLQTYIEHEGFDVRAMVLDDRILGGMRRRSGDDFRTNVSRNARAEPYTLSQAEQELALQASTAVGTRFAGVDLLADRSGTRYVIEVNAVPGWRAFRKVTGCDVARLVIESLETATN